MTDVNISPLPPGVRVETFTYSNGQTQTVYRAPFRSDGPKVTSENGRRVLAYEYAAYVFRWPEGTSKLAIDHGSLNGDRMSLSSDVPVTGRWHPSTLIEFAQCWATAEFRKYAR